MVTSICSKQEVEFKDKMIKGLYNAELKETCLFFMPKNQNRKKILRQH